MSLKPERLSIKTKMLLFNKTMSAIFPTKTSKYNTHIDCTYQCHQRFIT